MLARPEVVVKDPAELGRASAVVGSSAFSRQYTVPAPACSLAPASTAQRQGLMEKILRLISLEKAKGDMTVFKQVKAATKTWGESCPPDPQRVGHELLGLDASKRQFRLDA